MTLDSLLFFFLGFLTTIFLMLIVLPPIWNRAVVLAERKVRATIPGNETELQAEKDSLRAEHAMRVRRLEMLIMELQNRASSYRFELEKLRNHNNLLAAKNTEHEKKHSLHKHPNNAQHNKIKDLTKHNSALSHSLDIVTEKFEKLLKTHRKMNETNSVLQKQINKTKENLPSEEHRIETTILPCSGQTEELIITRENKDLDFTSITDKNLENRVIELGEELMREREKTIALEVDLARMSLAAELAPGTEANGSEMDNLKDDGNKLAVEIQDFSKGKKTPERKKILRSNLLTLAEKTISRTKLQS